MSGVEIDAAGAGIKNVQEGTCVALPGEAITATVAAIWPKYWQIAVPAAASWLLHPRVVAACWAAHSSLARVPLGLMARMLSRPFLARVSV